MITWVPGTCKKEFVVYRLVIGKWIEIGRTVHNWLEVPLFNTNTQPFGVGAVCS